MERTAIGIGIVMIVTEMIMRFTPKTFDKKRFAVPISILVALVLSVTDALIYDTGSTHELIWRGMIKAFVIAMGSGGAYSALKNYNGLSRE